MRKKGNDAPKNNNGAINSLNNLLWMFDMYKYIKYALR